jgi:hypothetical protein
MQVLLRKEALLLRRAAMRLHLLVISLWLHLQRIALLKHQLGRKPSIRYAASRAELLQQLLHAIRSIATLLSLVLGRASSPANEYAHFSTQNILSLRHRFLIMLSIVAAGAEVLLALDLPLATVPWAYAGSHRLDLSSHYIFLCFVLRYYVAVGVAHILAYTLATGQNVARRL